MDVKLYNTLTRKKETFKPIQAGNVGLYSCGPTVYNFAHIGNLRAYIACDVLKRTLELNNYKVKHVMNITDVGHLVSDADEGEDKIEKAAKRERKSALEIAEFYTKAFKQDLKKLNIIEPVKWVKATDYIGEQIKLALKLEKKGFTYETSDGIYFDTSRLKDYGKLARLDVRGLKEGARIEKNLEKRNPTDFAIWKFSNPPMRGSAKKRLQEWPSPWGVGFPGWHIECSVMSAKILGQPFDIHTGGIDHIPVHHTNEIAQSEAAFGKPLARYWLHNEFVTIRGGRMGKSKGNFITLNDLIKKGFDPLAYRYLCLLAHYRTRMDFSFKALAAAQNALNNLRRRINSPVSPLCKGGDQERMVLKAFNDDLDTPKALSILWKTTQPELFYFADKVLGLGLQKINIRIPREIKKLIAEREKARKNKDWKQADLIRKKIGSLGFILEDTLHNTRIYHKNL